MPEFLKEVLENKKRELTEKRKILSFPQLFRMVKEVDPHLRLSDFIRRGTGIIAEIKRGSPSKGVLFSGEGVEKLGKIYEAQGASALSVVTEENFFHGCLGDLQGLKYSTRIPVLRKDFIFDEYQILESKLSGGDAVLVIVSLLSLKKLSKFLDLIDDLGMEAVVEVHTRDDLEKAFDADAKIIGINNRDLKTFNVDLNTSRGLLPLIPDTRIKIVESGIKDEKDLLFYDKFKVNAFLIGEALVTASNPGEMLKKFCSILKKR